MTIGKIDNNDTIMAMRVDVLVFDGVFDLGLAALIDTLAAANELSPRIAGPKLSFDVQKVGLRRRIRTGQGHTVPLAQPRPRADVTMVAGLGCRTAAALDDVLARSDLRSTVTWLRRDRPRTVLAACTGTFVLAEASLLDGHTATTTWWLASTFRARYPSIALDPRRMLVESGPFVTAGAALAHLDLALWLIRSRSPRLADLVGRYLMIEARSTVALHAIPDHLAHADPVVRSFERWARDNLRDAPSMQDAAHAIGTSVRTLGRRTKAVLGKTPVGYLQDLRIEHAVHRLRTSDASVDEIAGEVGYADAVTLRNLLRRKTGRGVHELRRR